MMPLPLCLCLIALTAQSSSEMAFEKHKVTMGRMQLLGIARDGTYPDVASLVAVSENDSDRGSNHPTVQKGSWERPVAWPVLPRQLASALEPFLVPKYIVSIPEDAWGHPLLCGLSKDRRSFTLLSTGSDGKVDRAWRYSWPAEETTRDVVFCDEQNFASAPSGLTH